MDTITPAREVMITLESNPLTSRALDRRLAADAVGDVAMPAAGLVAGCAARHENVLLLRPVSALGFWISQVRLEQNLELFRVGSLMSMENSPEMLNNTSS